MRRRQFVELAGTAVVCGAAQAQQSPSPATYTYKTVAGHEIKADVHGVGDGVRKPVVIYIHGGALIMGSRKPVFGRFHSGLIDAGYVVVSIDYRLAPETKLPAIIEDVQAAHEWVRKSGPKLFYIDPDRLAVAGGSAGGYLTQMTGFCVHPRPRALVSYYGYGDIIAPWYSRADDFYRKQPLVPKEEATQAVGTTTVSEPPPKNNRGRFYLYTRQQGIWPKEVAGHDPDAEAKWFHRYCPIQNVSKHYPPILLIHGTNDTDVPFEESKKMDAALTTVHAEHQFITVPGAGHGLTGVTPEVTNGIAERAVEFIKAHIG